MGQQQLLLIVLGIVIIGIAIVVGINVFTASAIDSKRNNVIIDCITLGTLAQQHWRMPGSFGGGENSFDGSTSAAASAWQIPSILTTNSNGSFRITKIQKDAITILGTGNEVVTGNDSVQVSITFTMSDYTTTIIH